MSYFYRREVGFFCERDVGYFYGRQVGYFCRREVEYLCEMQVGYFYRREVGIYLKGGMYFWGREGCGRKVGFCFCLREVW